MQGFIAYVVAGESSSGGWHDWFREEKPANQRYVEGNREGDADDCSDITILFQLSVPSNLVDKGEDEITDYIDEYIWNKGPLLSWPHGTFACRSYIVSPADS